MLETTITRTVYSDLPEILAIERVVFPTAWSMEMFLLELSRPDGIAVTATRGSELVGYLICSPVEPDWHLMNIAVKPELQRTGIAKALMAKMIAQIDDPLARITLEVRPGNHGAVDLYEKFGFLPVGHRRRYYQDTGEDALIMWRTSATLLGSFEDVPNVDKRFVERYLEDKR